MNRTRALGLLILLPVALALTSCTSSSDGDGNGGPGPGDTTPPEATQIGIQDGATGVGLIERIEVTFSEAMAESTINAATFGVNERSVGGYVEYDADTRTASFLPDTLYAPESPHEFFVTEDVTDEAGNPIAAFSRSFETGPLDSGHLRDYLEPNDEFAESRSIEIGRWYRTLATWKDDGGEADSDWFQFTLDEAARVYIQTPIIYADDMNWVRGFYRMDGEEYVSAGSGVDPGDSVDWYFTLAPGTYLAEAHQGYPGHVLYDLRLTTGPPCDDDPFEDNDFLDEAAEITEGLLTDLRACRNDKDHYWIDLTAGETLTVTLEAQGSAGTRRIRIYDPQLAQVGYYNGTANPVTVEVQATQSGPHFIRVLFWADGLDYELDVSVE
jgi:hypothetical protein